MFNASMIPEIKIIIKGYNVLNKNLWYVTNVEIYCYLNILSWLDLDLFVVLRRVQQPGSYCDGEFTGRGNQCILHCKPLGIGK